MVLTLSRRTLIGIFGLILMLVAIGTTLIATSGRVHANGPLLIQPHTCANQPDSKSCDGQNPYQQHCVQDAKTVAGESLPAFFQGHHIGVAELRYSPACDSYWDRVISYSGAPVSTVSVLQSTLYTNSTPEPDGSLQVYTDMVYHHRGSPDAATFEIANDGPLVSVVLP